MEEVQILEGMYCAGDELGVDAGIAGGTSCSNSQVSSSMFAVQNPHPITIEDGALETWCLRV
jgi:hypothetical protein